MIEIGIRIDDPLAVSQDKPATVRGDVRAEASGPTGMTGMCMPRPPV